MLANDCDNQRIIVLRLIDDRLEYQFDLVSVEDVEKACVAFYPRRICFDAKRGFLYVGSGWKNAKSLEAKQPATNDGNADGNLTVWRILDIPVLPVESQEM
jgi:hypothetical protein